MWPLIAFREYRIVRIAIIYRYTQDGFKADITIFYIIMFRLYINYHFSRSHIVGKINKFFPRYPRYRRLKFSCKLIQENAAEKIETYGICQKHLKRGGCTLKRTLDEFVARSALLLSKSTWRASLFLSLSISLECIFRSHVPKCQTRDLFSVPLSIYLSPSYSIAHASDASSALSAVKLSRGVREFVSFAFRIPYGFQLRLGISVYRETLMSWSLSGHRVIHMSHFCTIRPACSALARNFCKKPSRVDRRDLLLNQLYVGHPKAKIVLKKDISLALLKF